MVAMKKKIERIVRKKDVDVTSLLKK